MRTLLAMSLTVLRVYSKPRYSGLVGDGSRLAFVLSHSYLISDQSILLASNGDTA